MSSIIRRPFRYRFFHAVFWLIGINFVIHFAIYFLGFRVLIYRLSMIPILVMNGWVWTLFTYMFVHGSFSHILFNMLGLFIFGVQVERQMGSREFLLFYLLTGTLAGVFSFIMYYLSGTPIVILMGASGAIYAVQLAYATLFPDSIIYLWGILPLRAPIMVLGFTVISLFFIVTGGGSNVAHLTHLAGFAFAWLYFVVRFGVNPWKRLRMR